MQTLAVFISGVLFTICWQFSQFVLLIQSLVIFVLSTVGLLGKDPLILKIKLYTFSNLRSGAVLSCAAGDAGRHADSLVAPVLPGDNF